MKHKKTITSIAFLLLGLGALHAQESPIVAGGEATGTGGTVSYSVGQIVYTTTTGSNGSTAQGVQQAYEIYTMGISETKRNITLSIYPNPTANYLTLKTEENAKLSYQLYDTLGKVIETKTVNSHSTNISLEGQPSATYFLRVTKNNQIVKTFKVVKN